MPNWLELLKLGSVQLIAICIGAAFLLFAPERFIGQFGLSQLRESLRGWIGFALIAALSMLIARVIRGKPVPC